MLTVYEPGFRLPIKNSPVVPVSVVYCVAVALSVTVTLAPVILAPEGSTTAPRKVPVGAWPIVEPATSTNRHNNVARKYVVFILFSPFRLCWRVELEGRRKRS